MDYGYARVSARDQNLSRQFEELKKFGIAPERIFADKKSGRDFERHAYLELLKQLKRGDLLVVKSIDRLGRNYDAIISEWSRITNSVGADILVLDMPLLDTRSKAETLVGKFISDIVLQVLSFVAENERQNIRTRQAEGIALAKARGVKFGRPTVAVAEPFRTAVVAYLEKNLTLTDALERAGVSRNKFYYHLGKIKKNGCKSA